jgi:ankyrin repeat protein
MVLLHFEWFLRVAGKVSKMRRMIKKGSYQSMHGGVSEFSVIKMTLPTGANLNYQAPGGLSLLHIAVQSGNISCVQLLLLFSAQLDFYAKDYSRYTNNVAVQLLNSLIRGYTPLHLAVELEQEDTVKVTNCIAGNSSEIVIVCSC